MYLQKINLKNKYALVTGAGKGLGRACAIALAEAGATVIALSRTSSDLDKLEKEIKKIKGKIIKIHCDVMNYDDLKKKITLKLIKANYGKYLKLIGKKFYDSTWLFVLLPFFILLTSIVSFIKKKFTRVILQNSNYRMLLKNLLVNGQKK